MQCAPVADDILEPPTKYYDHERGAVTVTQVPFDPEAPASISIEHRLPGERIEGVVTSIHNSPPFKVIETWQIPGPILALENETKQLVANIGQRDDEDKGIRYAPSKWDLLVFEIRTAKAPDLL